MSDPELGIVFENTPTLEGDAADVHDWIATYEKEYWRTMITNEPSPAFSIMASAGVQERIAQIASNNAAEQADLQGVFHVAISDVTVDGDAARGIACLDYRDVTVVTMAGPQTLEEAKLAEPTFVELSLSRVADQDRWLIETVQRIGPC